MCKRDGYFNVRRMPLSLYYEKIPRSALAKDFVGTYECFGNSALRAPFIESVFAGPQYVASTRLVDTFKKLRVRGIDFQPVYIGPKAKKKWPSRSKKTARKIMPYVELLQMFLAKEIDVAELHDCVNIHEVICLENCGLLKEGEGIHSADDGRTYAEGDIPVSLSGGLKSRGHPVGATGAYQLCEITHQLRGDFDGIRAEKPEVGMTVNVGGTGAAVTVNILRREE